MDCTAETAGWTGTIGCNAPEDPNPEASPD
jgi:hypothetical protein